jgi:phosphoglycolate phosphatase
MRLLLFDLDGTLVWSRGGIGRRALDDVFEERYGWTSACARVSFGGITDPLIVEQVFEHHGRSLADAQASTPEILAAYVQRLEAVTTENPGAVFALPGVSELIERLSARTDCILGVLTGNVEGGARLKLQASGVGQFHSVGAYGDEAPTRNGLLPVALDRANAERSAALVAADSVVIGDTPLDIGVARAHGARAVAVATGTCDRAALAVHSPDVLLNDLNDTDAVLEALGL